MKVKTLAAVAATAIGLSQAQQTDASSTYRATATSYCLTGTMADGTSTRPGSAASNRHPLGTRIRLTRPAHGRKNWVIRDRIGHGTELDLWVGSCGKAIKYGRKNVSYKISKEN